MTYSVADRSLWGIVVIWIYMNVKAPNVSVLICAYNAEKFINDALECVRRQTHKNYECIIVDDGSSDRTAKIVRRVAKTDGRFKLLVHETNRGLPSARNSALEIAKGQYVIMLDADDHFDKYLLKKTYKRATETSADIVVFNFDEYKTQKEVYQRKIIDEKVLPGSAVFTYADLIVSDFDTKLEALSNMSSNKLYASEFISSNHLRFNEKLLRNQDLEFGLRAYMLAKRITFIPESLMTYNTGIPSSNQSTLGNHPTVLLEALMSLKYFFESENILKRYRKDLNDLAIHHLNSVLLKISVTAQRRLLSELGDFFREFGITKKYIDSLSGHKRQILTAMMQNDFDLYLQTERSNLMDTIEDIALRIPPLEERIELELGELKHYRDEPSLHSLHTF